MPRETLDPEIDLPLLVDIIVQLFPTAHPTCKLWISEAKGPLNPTKEHPTNTDGVESRAVTQEEEIKPSTAARTRVRLKKTIPESAVSHQTAPVSLSGTGKPIGLALPKNVTIYMDGLQLWRSNNLASGNRSWDEVRVGLAELRVKLQRLAFKPIIDSDVLGAEISDFISYGLGASVSVFRRNMMEISDESVLIRVVIERKTTYYETALESLNQDLIVRLVKHASAR